MIGSLEQPPIILNIPIRAHNKFVRTYFRNSPTTYPGTGNGSVRGVSQAYSQHFWGYCLKTVSIKSVFIQLQRIALSHTFLFLYLVSQMLGYSKFSLSSTNGLIYMQIFKSLALLKVPQKITTWHSKTSILDQEMQGDRCVNSTVNFLPKNGPKLVYQ